MVLGFPHVLLHFDLIGIGLMLAMACCLIAVFVHSLRGRTFAMVASACAMPMLAVVLLYRGVSAPETAWPIMLGAIESAAVTERTRRVNDLRAHWNERTMRAVDWYRLARRWQVCHELWVEASCLRPAVSESASGLARERLDEIDSRSASYTRDERGFSAQARYELRSHRLDADAARFRLDITDLATGSTSAVLNVDGRAEALWSPDDRHVAITCTDPVGRWAVVVYEPDTAHLVEVPWPETVRRMDLEFGSARMWAIGWVEPGVLWVDVAASDGMGRSFYGRVIHRMADSRGAPRPRLPSQACRLARNSCAAFFSPRSGRREPGPLAIQGGLAGRMGGGRRTRRFIQPMERASSTRR